jgi:AraC-like DNA-binding protein
MYASSFPTLSRMRYQHHPGSEPSATPPSPDSNGAVGRPSSHPPVDPGGAGDSQRLTAIKSTTRDELYRRLLQARSFIDENFASELDLDKLANVACLSPHYFLRLFKQVFHKTPHQYMTDLRINYAAELLATTNLPITQICFEVGYTSLGSFSDLFRRRTGISPLAYRRRHQLDQPADAPLPSTGDI